MRRQSGASLAGSTRRAPRRTLKAAWAFSNALARDRAVPQSLDDVAIAYLGEQGVVDMVNLVGRTWRRPRCLTPSTYRPW